MKRFINSLADPEKRAWIFRLSLALVFVIAGAVRLYHLRAPGMLIDREFTSAILARAFYFEHNDSVAGWEQAIAAVEKDYQPILEPPITEYLVSLLYRAIGSEQLWAAHLLTALFWVLGGFFLYEAAKMVVSREAAVAGTVYYLFTPLGILVSRSFQPDALMMLLFLLSLYLVLKYYEQPRPNRLLWAAGASGLAMLYRPLILFALLGAFIALAIQRAKSWRFLLERDFVLFMAASLLPPSLYYGYGILVAGFLRWKVTTSFLPQLFIHREYWEGWLQIAVDSLGLPVLLGAWLGLPTLAKGKPRFLLGGLWTGYFVFGLVFNMHIHTHNYYQAQLIPVLALSLGSLTALFLEYLRKSGSGWAAWAPVAAALLLFAFLDARTVSASIGAQSFESPQMAREIGDVVGHSSQAVFVSRYYGLPLEYYGEMAGTAWPKSIEYWLYRRPGEVALSVDARMDSLPFEPNFFVITDFDEFNNRYADLKFFLERSCTLLAEGERYLVYDGHCSG